MGGKKLYMRKKKSKRKRFMLEKHRRDKQEWDKSLTHTKKWYHLQLKTLRH